MKPFIKSSMATTMALLVSLTTLAPAHAVPLPSVKVQQASDVTEVQHRRDHRRGWYQGHRGYRDRRPGYRRHSDGWWYPLAAFGAAAIIGGAIANQPARRGASAHVAWCSDRYRTYRASDNTYVPRAGVRAQCRSPYN